MIHGKCLELKSIGYEFWTSGSNEGESCNVQNVFSWCSASNNDSAFVPEFLAPVDNKYLKNFKLQDSARDRCVIFKIDGTVNEKSMLEHSPCDKVMRYICEVSLKNTPFRINLHMYSKIFSQRLKEQAVQLLVI
jgi:hypothetical protein